MTEERVREVQRLDKVLQDANVKLSSVVSQTMGVTGRLILDAWGDGQRDPEQLAKLARGKLKGKIFDLAQCVPGRFNRHHAAMTRELLAHIDYLDAAVARLDARVEAMVAPFADARERLITIPGVGIKTAQIIIAEIGVDMARFPTRSPGVVGRVVPGEQRVRRQHRSTHTRSGNPWLASALVEASWSVTRSKDCYLAVPFWRIAKRRGQQRSLIAVAHTILVICWHLLTESTTYTELGADYHARNDNPDRRRRQLVNQLERLGYQVDLSPAA